MTAGDTNVLVAALASWHEHNAAAAAAVAGGLRLISHVAVETYAVLTRLPPPHRVEPDHVIRFLKRHFPDPPLMLPPASLVSFLESLPARGITGVEGLLDNAMVVPPTLQILLQAGERLLRVNWMKWHRALMVSASA